MKNIFVLLSVLAGSFLFAQSSTENSELKDLYKETTAEVKKTEQETGKSILNETTKENSEQVKKTNPEEFLKYLTSESVREKIAAIKIMGASKQKKYTREIEPFLKDKNPLIVEAAILAYGYSKDDSYIPMLRPMLKVSNNAIRNLAIKSIFNIGGPKAEDIIIELLDDGDSSVRSKAAETLASMKSKAAWNRLTRSMCCDPAVEVKRSAAKALAEILNPHSINDLKKSLQDPDKTVSFYSAIALARMKDKSGIKILIEMLTYEDITLVALTLDALSYLDGKELIEPLSKLSLNDKELALAKKAGIMLKKLEGKYKR